MTDKDENNNVVNVKFTEPTKLEHTIEYLQDIEPEEMAVMYIKDGEVSFIYTEMSQEDVAKINMFFPMIQDFLFEHYCSFYDEELYE